MFKYTNHLIQEISPYLLQHAHNPVDWYPWGKEAFALARKEDKPIFLSIGYAACHWCHVMEKESFENEEIAALMNRLFVNIKVDREERPDIDQKYMRFVQMTTGSGGWPLTVFLTPEGEPFYGGTYFPAEDRYGKPGLKKLLPLVADYFHNNKTQLHTDLQKIRWMLDPARHEVQGKTVPDFAAWKRAVEELSTYYDRENGGLGKAPKFPSTGIFDLFLRYFAHTDDPHYWAMTEYTLQRMAMGGMYDQLGGGFARYSVDARWLVPHFEKMLYDNALLSDLYLSAFQISKDTFYRHIAEETLHFVAQELSDSNGGFFSSIDADSEGKEGAFYLWSKDEILNILGPEQGNLFCERFGVSAYGNFEGQNILFVHKSFEQLAREFNLPVDKVKNEVAQAQSRLLEERNKRVRPATDDKVLTSWNGLMLSAFAHAYQIAENEHYAHIIRKNIRFVTTRLYKEGRLLHVYGKGQSKLPAFVDDYAYYIQALLDSYEALFDETYLQMAVSLAKTADEIFYDRQAGGYFYSANQDEALTTHFLKSEQDNALPAASAVMILNQLRLYHFTNEPLFLQRAESLLRKYGHLALENPFGLATYLRALDFYLTQPVEVVIWPQDDGRFPQMRKVLFEDYLPNKVIFVKAQGTDNPSLGRALLQGRKPIKGHTSVYVCVGQTCSLPVVRADELKTLLQKQRFRTER